MARKFWITFIAVVAALLLTITTGFCTYRAIMLNLEIEQDDQCYYITVFDSTDIYEK